MQYPQIIEAINLNKVKYMMMDKLAKILIANDVIIFGGFVRDRIIHDHFATKFLANQHNLVDNFDDEHCDPDTNARLLIPKDIDCFLRGDQDAVDNLYNILRNENFHVVPFTSRKQYFDDVEINQQKVIVKILNGKEIGLPYNMSINLDVLFCVDEKLKPPFGKLDLECNAFIMTNEGVILSNQTGTFLDKMDPLFRKRHELNILQKMLCFEADVALFSCEKVFKSKDKMIRFNRMISMQNRGWKINNQVYSIINNPGQVICDVCRKELDSKQVIKLKCCGKYLHKSCLIIHIRVGYETGDAPQCGNDGCEDREWHF